MHLQSNSAEVDGSTPTTVEARKSAQYPSPGQVSFDGRSYKLIITFDMESFRRLAKIASEFIDQLATRTVG